MRFRRQSYINWAFIFLFKYTDVWTFDADLILLLQPVVRLYSVPANAFTGEEEDDAEAIEEADDDSEN